MEEIKVAKPKHYKAKLSQQIQHRRFNNMPQALTVMIVIMLSAMIFILAFKDVIPGNKEVFTLIVGNLMGAFLTACSFWFSKKDTHRQDETLKQRLDT